MNWLRIKFGRLDEGRDITKTQKYKMVYKMISGETHDQHGQTGFVLRHGTWQYIANPNWVASGYSERWETMKDFRWEQLHKAITKKSIIAHNVGFPPSSIESIAFEWGDAVIFDGNERLEKQDG